jgi:hypothetical protein
MGRARLLVFVFTNHITFFIVYLSIVKHLKKQPNHERNDRSLKKLWGGVFECVNFDRWRIRVFILMWMVGTCLSWATGQCTPDNLKITIKTQLLQATKPEVSNARSEWNVSDWSSGLYLLELRSEEGVLLHQKRFIKR